MDMSLVPFWIRKIGDAFCQNCPKSSGYRRDGCPSLLAANRNNLARTWLRSFSTFQSASPQPTSLHCCKLPREDVKWLFAV